MHLFASFLVLIMLGVNLKCIAAQTQRPYAFGFTIDKQQHRSEKKDERGIVMGEFGFITADGIYHVTVYATDEEGKFRILAMRSYPYEARPKTIEMVVAPKPRPALTTTTPPPALPRHNFANPACSGCFLTNNAPKKATDATAPKKIPGKVEIRTLSRPLNNDYGNNVGAVIGSKNGKKMAERLLPQVLSNVQQTSKTIQQPLKATIGAQLHRTLAASAVAENKINAAIEARDTIIPHPDIPKRTPAGRENTITLGSQITKTTTTTTQITTKAPAHTTTKAPAQTKFNTTKKPQITTTATTSTTQQPFKTTQQQLTIPKSTKSPKTNVPTVSTGTNTPLTSTAKTITNNKPKSPKTYTNNVKSAAPSAGTFNAKANDANNPKLQPRSGSNGSGGSAAAGKPAGAGGSAASKVGSGAPVSRAGPIGGGGGFGGGAKSAGSDTGDLYRFKYTLDYNGHTETGSRNGNKQGSFFSIGDDNVERTIEYIANEFGYQPRIRWRKLDAPIQVKENTLKDYEFVWFKKE